MQLLYWILVVCFLLSGCAENLKMVPAQKAHKFQILEGVAIGGLSGLSVLVEAGGWGGKLEILEKITPIKITIYNKSGRPLKIQYSHFCFQGKKSNKTYAAMPPYEIRGTVLAPCIVLPYPFPVQSAVEHNEKFLVAPHCARMYPDFRAYTEDFLVDINYYNRYYNLWARIKLPTVEMLSKIIPDGVIGDGGYVSGYLYFEKIAPTDKEIDFCANLIDAQSDIPVGTIRIPFCIVKK